jgi:hypothetical protein
VSRRRRQYFSTVPSPPTSVCTKADQSPAQTAALTSLLVRSPALCGRRVAEKQLSDPSQRIHKVLETARVLYGLIHARYILTAQGLSDMVSLAPRARGGAPSRRAEQGAGGCGSTTDAPARTSPPALSFPMPTVLAVSSVSLSQKAKFKASEFGSCPRTLCEKQTVLPVGLSDSVSLSGENPMKLFCARCRELYDHTVPGGNYIDGAFFGSTFPHLFLQTYGELRPQRCTRRYIPRVFGFKVHQSAQGSSSSSSAGVVVEALEEWPTRPKNEPVSDWDS